MLGNILFGRKLDHGNPNAGNLGADFGRLGLPFWSAVDADQLEMLGIALREEKSRRV